MKTKQYHPLPQLLLPQNQRRYPHHLVPPEEMSIKIITTIVVEKDGEEEEEEDMIEIGIIVVKMRDGMILMIVMIEGDEAVLIDTMIEIGI